MFSVAFPSVIATGLFVLLWRKPEVLYAPGDYSAETPIRDYVEAVRGTAPPLAVKQATMIEQAVANAIETTVKKLKENPAGIRDVDTAELARSVAGIEVRKSSIDVKLPLTPGGSDSDRLLFPVGNGDVTVDEFLDEPYFTMNGLVPPYTYGETWVLVDQETKRALHSIGSTYVGSKTGKRGLDNRLLAEVGIEPGKPMRCNC